MCGVRIRWVTTVPSVGGDDDPAHLLHPRSRNRVGHAARVQAARPPGAAVSGGYLLAAAGLAVLVGVLVYLLLHEE
jgi:hypothetical protein